MINEFVLVRTRTAGVHCGVLAECSGTAVLLKDARRVWRWRGANSLHELATGGADEKWTRISEPVARILLTEAVEVIPTTEKAKENLSRSRWSAD